MTGTPRRFVEPLDENDREVLKHLKDHGETRRIRERAHAVLLSGLGKSLNEMAEIFGVHRNTVDSWLRDWEQSGPAGLADAPRAGAPSKLTDEEQEQAIELLKNHPHSPKQVLSEIKKVTGKQISADTLRRIARKAGLRWKRMRRSSKARRDEKEFRNAQGELDELIMGHKSGDWNLYYFDEAGFSLTPSVPYGWQEVGKTIEIPSRKSKRLNVLGFMGYDSQLSSYTVEGAVDGEIVCSVFDDFADTITELTVVVLDNASVHANNKFEGRRPSWEKKGLFVYFLPPYCPELNLIEILWRMIKYQWLPLEAYENFKSLVTTLQETLAKIGSQYTICFGDS